MLQEKAKANIRKLRAWNLVTSVPPILLVVVSMILMLADILTFIQTLLLYVVAGLFERIAARIIMAKAWKKYVHNIMDEDLDAPLFVEILSLVGKYDPFAIHQLDRLYAEGRHADVVSLCAKQLDNPYAKRQKLGYLAHMALAYFSLGDDKKLAEIHEAIERFLNSLKDPAKGRRRIPIQAFYAAYLRGDTEACEAYFAANPPKARIAAVQRYLQQARVAQLKGDTERAGQLLKQVLTEAPNTPVAVTAKAHLAAMERGEGYDKAFPEAIPDPLFPVVTSEKRHKAVKIVMRVCVIVVIVLLAFELIAHVGIQIADRAYREQARATVEAEYNGVEVLDRFYLTNGGPNLDDLALCATDEGFVVAALYCRSDNPDVLLSNTLAIFTEEELTGSILPSHAFHGYTTEYFGLCAFYETEAEIPADAVVSIPVTVYGRDLWFAVTDVRN